MQKIKIQQINFLQLFLITTLLFFFSCNTSNNKQENVNLIPIKVVDAKGFVVPKDSISAPKVVLVDESKLQKIPVGKPDIIATNTNVHIAGIPKVIPVIEPKPITPGTDTFLLPEKTTSIDSPFIAGNPEITIAKDMVNKDQNPANFSSFGKLQGLKHGYVKCMTEDKLGNIWFGTLGGVSKYDGKSFTHFTNKEGLSSNTIISILEDKAGNLWLGTFGGGVNKYDGKSFTHFTEKEGLNNNVLSIAEDKSGNIWFGTYGGGVVQYDGKKFTAFTDKQGLADNAVWSILQDKKGNLWFGTEGGLSKYDGKSFANYTTHSGLPDNIIKSSLEDKDGNIWFGINNVGVCKYDGKTFTTFTDKEGLANNFVYSILQDKSGNLWFSTDGDGISKYDGKTFANFTEKDGLSSNSIWSSLEDKSGNLWFGSLQAGVNKYNGKTFTNFTKDEGLLNNIVYPIMQDKSENIWFGSDNGGISIYDGKSFTNFTDKQGLVNNYVYYILQDKSGNIWFSTEIGGVTKFDGKTFTNYNENVGMSSSIIYTMLEDKSGNIWFGTEKEGVSKYDGKSFTYFTQKEGLSSNSINKILEDKSGNIWFATYGGGITKYDGKIVTHFTEKEGLPTNFIYSMTVDKSGNIWFGTDGKGILKYNGKTFTNFTEDIGLLNNTVLSILQDKSGSLWFGTRFGMSKLTPKKSDLLNEKIEHNTISESDVFFKNYTAQEGFLGIGCMRNSILETNDGTIWIGANDRLTAYHPENVTILSDAAAPNIQLTAIDLFNENILWSKLEQKKDSNFILGNGVKVGNFEFDGLSKWYNLPEHLSLSYNNNYLTFNFIGITQMQSQKVKYKFKLEGIDKNWSAITTRNNAPYGNLPHGTYTFKVKAMNSDGYWSKEFKYKFTIRPPWWLTWLAKLVYVLLAIGSVFFIVWWNGRRLRARANELEIEVDKATIVIRKQKEEVETEKKKSDDLLLNILPQEVAEELKQNGAAAAKQFNNVTVLFTDFVNFTGISEQLSPTELVAEIHKNFTAFDAIIEKYDLEKIKTIGDAYMAVCGLPNETSDHAQRLVKAAIEIRDYIAQSNGKFQIRIGINSGAVVAGIVGVKKYAYDIWGDTVNTASRIESSSEPNKINISGSTYQLVKEHFNCEFRGKIAAKGKGEIDMYFVENK